MDKNTVSLKNLVYSIKEGGTERKILNDISYDFIPSCISVLFPASYMSGAVE